MTPLAPPQIPANEDKTLKAICEQAKWKDHRIIWQAAYNNYRAARGDPWAVAPAVFSALADQAKVIAVAQRAFYISRSGGGPIAKIRKTPGLVCCPMCGSSHPGTLDHYLPKEAFPEFSILPCNLVPACPHCNSGVKGGGYRGAASPERFIHPYFDTIATDAIWFVEIQPPFEAARFHPHVAASVDLADQPMVQFHLDNILGLVFQDHISTQWSLLPSLTLCRLDPNEAITVATLKKQLANDLRDTAVTNGQNGWRTALLRGVIANRDAISFIADRASTLPSLPQ